MGEDRIIWGSSGHGIVLSEILVSQGHDIIAIFDNDVDAIPILKDVEIYYGISGFETWIKYRKNIDRIKSVIAIGGGRGADRLNLRGMFSQSGVGPASVIASSAIVSKSATIEIGSQILDGTIIASRVSIGSETIVNHGAQIDHESIIGRGVHIAPGAVLCGCVKVGECAFVGAGSVVLPRLEIGSYATVGAGAVVTKNVPDYCTVIGNPARITIDRRIGN